ncbi:MAG: hypothetical protein RL088_1856 [Verrucomicrobiota bacterium]|jgi:hypothetical protein
MVAVTIVMAGSVVCANFGMLSFAKNYSMNSSHTTVRDSIDRIGASMSSAASEPQLISTDGSVVGSGSAPGIRFDQFRGGPYILTHPGGTGIAAGTSVLTVTRSVHKLASPPIPAVGDVLKIEGMTERISIASVTTGAIDAKDRQTHIVTLSSPLKSAVNWDPNSPKTANLLRANAYVVVRNGNRNELRFFPSAERIADFAKSTAFTLVCNNIGSAPNDTSPFSLSTMTDFGNRKLLNVALRVRARDYDNRLEKADSKNVNSAMEVTAIFTPKSS